MATYGIGDNVNTIAIEGINGAGKTPAIQLTLASLASEGLNADTYAPYHLVREKIVEDDLYPLWADRPDQAVQLLHQTIDEIEADARARQLDVLIFDRHWVTAFVQALQHPPITQWWGDRFVPTLLLTSPVSHLLRLAERGYQEPWLQPDTLKAYVNDYERVFSAQPQRFIGRFSVASSTQNLQPIADHVTKLITQERI